MSQERISPLSCGREDHSLQEDRNLDHKWDVAVVGGGVIGLWSSLHLARKGARVLLLDEARGEGGSSVGNAGLIVPGRCRPLPGPGRIREGLAGLLGTARSPLRIRPGLDPDLWGWLLRFALSCRSNRFETGSRLLLDMASSSLRLMERELLAQGAASLLSREGVLYPYFRRGSWINAVQEAWKKERTGQSATVLSAGQAREMEPALSGDLFGAVLQEADNRAEPESLLSLLQGAAEREGVKRVFSARAYALSLGSGRRVERVMTSKGGVRADSFLLATGSNMQGLLKSAGLWLPIRSGAGWSITFPWAENVPLRGTLLEEDRVALTPWGDGFRITGGLELSSRDGGLERLRLQGILHRAKRRLPGLDYAGRPRVWHGHRPLTPDGLPVVGRMPEMKNLWVASGHGHLGMTLGPATGWLIPELMQGSQEAAWRGGLSPERFL